VALLWLALLAWARPLMLPDEGRYVGVAWEMMRSGDWLTPTLNGLPYFHKPPLFYWITAASMSLFGVGELPARAAPLLGAWAGAMAVFLFLRRWWGTSAALLALVVLLAQPLGALSYWVPVLLIGVGASAHQAWSANIFTTVSDMFPQKAVASVVGIGGMAGGLGGVLLTKLGGWVFDTTKAQGDVGKGYMIMFTICALAYLVAWMVMKLLVPRHKEITR